MLEWNFRNEIMYSTPLQKLYEQVYFTDYDLTSQINMLLGIEEEDDPKKIKQIDKNPEEKRCGVEEFQFVIEHDVISIDPETEFDFLIDACPKIMVKNKKGEKEYFILYKVLANEMKDLARLKIPLRNLYDRFLYDKDKPQREQTKEKDLIANVNHKDKRLQHLNNGYKRSDVLKQFQK